MVGDRAWRHACAERSREKQRLLKVLEAAGIKLDVVASDTFGVSGRAMLDALVAGERDPHVLAGLARGVLRNKTDDLRLALAGRFTDHHGQMVSLHLTRIERAMPGSRVISPSSSSLTTMP